MKNDTTNDRLAALHPQIIQNYLDKGVSKGIPLGVQKLIDVIDKVPDLHRRFQSVSRTAREMTRLYKDIDISFAHARTLVYKAINYFHLNNEVKNEAWDNYYADKMDELGGIAAKMGNITEARRCFEKARLFRTNKDENAIDPEKLKPVVHVISPMVTPKMLGVSDEIDMRTLWVKKKETFNDAEKFINGLEIKDSQKAKILKDAAENLNIEDAEYTEE